MQDEHITQLTERGVDYEDARWSDEEHSEQEDDGMETDSNEGECMADLFMNVIREQEEMEGDGYMDDASGMDVSEDLSPRASPNPRASPILASPAFGSPNFGSPEPMTRRESPAFGSPGLLHLPTTPGFGVSPVPGQGIAQREIGGSTMNTPVRRMEEIGFEASPSPMVHGKSPMVHNNVFASSARSSHTSGFGHDSGEPSINMDPGISKTALPPKPTGGERFVRKRDVEGFQALDDGPLSGPQHLLQGKDTSASFREADTLNSVSLLSSFEEIHNSGDRVLMEQQIRHNKSHLPAPQPARGGGGVDTSLSGCVSEATGLGVSGFSTQFKYVQRERCESVECSSSMLLRTWGFTRVSFVPPQPTFDRCQLLKLTLFSLAGTLVWWRARRLLGKARVSRGARGTSIRSSTFKR